MISSSPVIRANKNRYSNSTLRRLRFLLLLYIIKKKQQDVKYMNTYITGTTVKQLRESRKLTQAELADKIGVSSKTVSK